MSLERNTLNDREIGNPMGRPRHLKNAPIVEALVDLQVHLPADARVEQFDSFYKGILQSYPKKQERRRWEGRFSLDGKVEGQKTEYKGIDGYRYTSADGTQIIQTRLDGYTFSRLRPYETWEQLRDQALKHWRMYVEVAHPNVVHRIALRYINRLEIQRPLRDFSDYLTAPPIIPKELPQGLSNFLTRVVIPKEPIGNAIITQALQEVKGNVIPIILDIDVIHVGQYSPKENRIVGILEELRLFKNEIFFASVTEELLGVYE
jgi:uncharacterized protein (TIGR04255 family)